ncbi:MAG: TSUP family transporter [Candidatus Omnitrophica bacterium]|nr:TSUP family transporter [Candidatus Omnitrophota bacterium]
MEALPYVIFTGFSFFAAGIATLAGFGSSTLLVPLAVMFLPLRQAIFLVACFHLFNNVFKVTAFRREIDGRLALIFGIPSIIFSFAGAVLISLLPADIIKTAIAVFLMAFSVYSWARPDFKIPAKNGNAVIGGASSGFLAGLIGMGGAVRGMFLIAFRLPKKSYIATSAVIALVIDCTRVPAYIFTGAVVDRAGFLLIPFLVISAYLGVRAGKKYLESIDQETFRKIVLIAIFLVALKLFF